eukprot:scaffold5182_cov77-Cylindrotheca_fusiformis.AAC.1
MFSRKSNRQQCQPVGDVDNMRRDSSLPSDNDDKKTKEPGPLTKAMKAVPARFAIVVAICFFVAMAVAVYFIVAAGEGGSDDDIPGAIAPSRNPGTPGQIAQTPILTYSTRAVQKALPESLLDKATLGATITMLTAKSVDN